MNTTEKQLDLKSLPVTSAFLIHEAAICFNHEFSESILDAIHFGDFLSMDTAGDYAEICPCTVYRFNVLRETEKSGERVNENYFDVDIYNEQTLNKIRLTMIGSQISALMGQQVIHDYS